MTVSGLNSFYLKDRKNASFILDDAGLSSLNITYTSNSLPLADQDAIVVAENTPAVTKEIGTSYVTVVAANQQTITITITLASGSLFVPLYHQRKKTNAFLGSGKVVDDYKREWTFDTATLDNIGDLGATSSNTTQLVVTAVIPSNTGRN